MVVIPSSSAPPAGDADSLRPETEGGEINLFNLHHPPTECPCPIVAFDNPLLAGGAHRAPRGTIMPDPLAGLPPRFLRTPEAARFLGLSGRTLEKHRTYGTGPKYRKIGGRVVYALDDLQAWADLGAKQSTSDPGKGTVHPARWPDGHARRDAVIRHR